MNSIIGSASVRRIDPINLFTKLKEESRESAVEIVKGAEPRLILLMWTTDIRNRYILEMTCDFRCLKQDVLYLHVQVSTRFQVDLTSEIVSEETMPINDFKILAIEALAHARVYFANLTKGTPFNSVGLYPTIVWGSVVNPLMEGCRQFLQAGSPRWPHLRK